MQLNIIHTVASLKHSAGGPSRTVPSLCHALGQSGATVHLVAQAWPTKDDKDVIPPPAFVTTHLLHATYIPIGRFPYSFHHCRAVTDLCLSFGAAIIHDNGLWLPSNHFVAKAAREMKLPLVIQPRGMLEPWALNFRAWKKRLAWKLYQKRDLESASLLVATSEQEAASIRKVGLRQPVAVIPNGIDLPEWKPRTISDRRDHTALFLSRIHPIKGLLNLVKAWERVQPEGWRMIVAGPDEGNHRADVEMALRRAGLEKDFTFVGPVEGDEKDKLYRQADLFILPTFSENFGVVVAEALSYGVPVITTKGAPWEGLLTHKCGWWVEIGEESLAEAIREAVKMTDVERMEMGERGRRYIESSFSWPRIAEEMLSVYRWILNFEKSPSCVRFD